MKLGEARQVFERVANNHTWARERLHIKIANRLLGVRQHQDVLEFFTPKNKVVVDLLRRETTIQRR